MATVNTNDLRIQNAKNFIDSLNKGSYPSVSPDTVNDSNSYLFIGRPTPWVNDTSPPLPKNNHKDFYDTWHQALAAKRIYDTDAYHVIPRLTWTSGVTFDMYRHDYEYSNPSSSGATDLYDCIFYTINSQNDLYVCLYNGTSPGNRRGVASTVEPLGQSTDPFYTSDGYQWLYLFTLSSSLLEDNSTNNFIPIPKTSSLSPKNGSIYTVVVTSSGSGYTTSPIGVTNQIPYYYCHIIGDGTGAVARVSITSGSVTSVEVILHGEGYSYASLDFRRNHVYRTLDDALSETNGLDPLGDGAFQSSVIISPPGGWGTDLPRELGGTRVGVFVELNNRDDQFAIDSTFRQIGILQNLGPYQTDNQQLLCLYYRVRLTVNSGDDYFVGETIRQGDESIGRVVSWDSQLGVLGYIQDPNYHTVDGKLIPFSGTTLIIGDLSKTVGTPLNTTSEIDGDIFQEGYCPPEVDKFSGVLSYITNISPVIRDRKQSEKISLVIQY